MKYLPSMLIIVATSLSACATPPKVAPTPEQEKTVNVVPETKASPTLPGSYTQKGVTVKVTGLWQSPEGAILGVMGTAKNVTASDLRFCQITLAVLNQDGTKADDAKATTKSLKSAQVWRFQAALTHPGNVFYAVTSDKVIAIPAKDQKATLANLK